MIDDIRETAAGRFKQATLWFPSDNYSLIDLPLSPRTAQDRHGWLIAPIGISLVLALLVWAGQSPTRFEPPLKRPPVVLGEFPIQAPEGAIYSVCQSSTAATTVTSITGKFGSTISFAPGIICYRLVP